MALKGSIVCGLSLVSSPSGSTFLGNPRVYDVAGGGSTVQAVRKSNNDRTPASRRFARERRAFKLAKFDKINLMAATFIPHSDSRKARRVPGAYQEAQSRKLL